jgi:hypothetical protein
MGYAHEPGGGGESVFFAFIRQRSWNEHEGAIRANQNSVGAIFPPFRMQNSA